MSLFDFDNESDAAPAGPSGPLVRVRLTVAYDGTGFKGFAANPGVRTVAGALTGALERVLRCPVQLTCAGRTDTGVHAWGQVVHFDVPAERELDLVTVQRSVNKQLGPRIVVRDAAVVPDTFDARRSALSRRYRYDVLNRPVPDPFLASTSWHVPDPLDLRAMQLACDPLYGEHDFSAFCRRPPGTGPDQAMVRRVVDARWRACGDGLLRFEVEASAFCHQMVRSVVALLVAVGLGKKRAGDVAWIIASRDRAQVGSLAPPHGLMLWAVRYPELSRAPAPPADEGGEDAVVP